MESSRFKYFVAVGEELSFARAAERLNMASSPLSRQIANLEKELGIELFVRTTRTVRLTEAGAYLLRQIQSIDAAVESSVVKARRIARGAGGTLTIGFSGSATYDVLPKIIRAFREEQPDADIDIIGEMDSARQVASLKAGRLSIGFVRDVEVPEGIEAVRVHSEGMVLLVPADHELADKDEVSVADLRDEPLISYVRSSVVSLAVDGTCRSAGFEPKVVGRAKESFALACMVASGLGIALAPAAAQHLKLDGLVSRELPAAECEQVHLNMVWSAQHPTPRLVEAFRDTALRATGLI